MRQIRGGEKQTCMARYEAHVARGGMVHHAAKGHAITSLGRGNARQLVLWREVASVRHFQWLINLALDELLERHFGGALGDLAQEKEINVAVAEHSPGQ